MFSQSKINECYADLTYPTLYGLDNLLTPAQEREVPPWRERNDTLFFRGATSGALPLPCTSAPSSSQEPMYELDAVVYLPGQQAS